MCIRLHSPTEDKAWKNTEKKLIKNATVFDGHSSGLAQGKKIVIEDDIVTEITADEVSEENFDEVFDGTGMVAMPGMTDAHVHMGCLFAKGEFPVDYATVLTVAKCNDGAVAGLPRSVMREV